MRPVRIGFVGLGSVAWGPYMNSVISLHRRGLAEAVAACDVREEKRRAVSDEFGISAFSTDYRDVVESDEVDLVLVLTSMRELRSNRARRAGGRKARARGEAHGRDAGGGGRARGAVAHEPGPSRLRAARALEPPRPDPTSPIRYTPGTTCSAGGRWRRRRRDATIRVLREQDILWRLEGEVRQSLIGVHVATEHLTVASMSLLPGENTDTRTHGGDLSLYLLSGTLNILADDGQSQRWFELKPRDGFFLPAGTPHQYYNMSGEPVELTFGVAPSYLPGPT